jgi:hypothetical protein
MDEKTKAPVSQGARKIVRRTTTVEEFVCEAPPAAMPAQAELADASAQMTGSQGRHLECACVSRTTVEDEELSD